MLSEAGPTGIVCPRRTLLKVMLFGPGDPSAAAMAARSEPGPESAAVVTTIFTGTGTDAGSRSWSMFNCGPCAVTESPVVPAMVMTWVVALAVKVPVAMFAPPAVVATPSTVRTRVPST